MLQSQAPGGNGVSATLIEEAVNEKLERVESRRFEAEVLQGLREAERVVTYPSRARTLRHSADPTTAPLGVGLHVLPPLAHPNFSLISSENGCPGSLWRGWGVGAVFAGSQRGRQRVGSGLWE